MFKKILLAGLALIAAFAANAQGAAPIRIGAFVARTGQAAFLGEPGKKTLELFVSDLNKAGGLLGRKVELILYDSKSNAKDATDLVRRLLDQDKVDFLIGGVTTGETMAVVPLVEEARIPYLSLAGASVIVNPVKKYVFKTAHTDRMSVEKIYTQIRREGGSRVALLAGSGGYDQSCRNNANELAPGMAIKLVADEQHGAGDSDVTVQLTNIRRANPDAIIYCGFGAPSALVAKNHNLLGLQQKLYMTVGVASRAYIEAAGNAAEGSRVTASGILGFEDMPASDPLYAVTKRFSDAYKAAYAESPSSFAGVAYDAILLATEAIKAAKTTEKEQVRDALENLRGVAGINGVFSYGPGNHQGITAESLKVMQVVRQQFRIVR